MIKVLFISYNGLLEPILSSQAVPYLRELAKRGFEFILLTYEKKKDLERAGRYKICAIKNELRSAGIEWLYLKYHKKPRFLSTIFDMAIGAAYCLFLIPAKKIKIVHVRGITPGSIMIFLSRIFSVKILFDMRGRLAEEMAAGGLWEEKSIAFKLIKEFEKELLEKADAVTVLTKRHFDLNKNSTYLKDQNIPMEVIPCCVDTGKFYCDPKESIDFKKSLGLDGKFILMYQGKIGTFYFIDYMLDFYKVMIGITPNIVLLILTTDDATSLLKRANAIGIIEDNIKVANNVEFGRIPQYMRIADAGIFFINSYNKLGSSPIKMGEFLASGVPVIINPGVGDTEELVRTNRVGVVVNDFTTAQYKNAVYELFRLKKEGEELRKRCRDTATSYLSLENGVNKYYEIYRALS